KYLGTVVAVALTVNLVPGVTVTGGPSAGPATTGEWTTILLVAVVWSVITLVVRPVLSLLTLPITIITFGLFSFVLNAFLFYAMSWLVPGFEVAGFLSALLGAVVLSILSWMIHKIL
ncbi:MAG: phage holin family protein, partial [Patescibacteria group bacterium]